MTFDAHDCESSLTKRSAVTAVYKGTSKNGPPALLRSYDSRKEPPPENICTIWQAGRATCATGLAFKPIQIGHSVFIDEGNGKYNPAPIVLDEAAVNEWPGRDVGVFVSIGTGRRPSGTNHQQSLWWEGFVGGGSIGDFAEAKRRLISKIEGCEETHRYMQTEHLSRRGVNPENYYRFNVEVGVGEFGMNEWHRLADISTNTRRYLTRGEVQRANVDAAMKLARIHRARTRALALASGNGNLQDGFDEAAYIAPSDPFVFFFCFGDVRDLHAPLRIRPHAGQQRQHPYQLVSSSQDKFTVVSSDEYPQPADVNSPPPRPPPLPRRSPDIPSYRSSSEGLHQHPASSAGSFVPTPRHSSEDRRDQEPSDRRPSPPPLPPKTPLQVQMPPEPPRRPTGPLGDGNNGVSLTSSNSIHNGLRNGLHNGNNIPHGPLPYPDTDGPPPLINLARKPDFNGR